MTKKCVGFWGTQPSLLVKQAGHPSPNSPPRVDCSHSALHGKAGGGGIRSLLRFSHAGTSEALALPALKRVIRVETPSRSAKALVPPHKCGGSHFVDFYGGPTRT
jgi:hypothetical protein